MAGCTNVDYTFYIYFRLQTSDYKPQALRESSYRPKEPETKPAGEMPLFDQLKIKMRKTSRKLQVFCVSRLRNISARVVNSQ